MFPLQQQRGVGMVDLHAVPVTASPEVPSTRMCHDEVGNGNVSVLAFSVKGNVVLVTVSQAKQVWQQDKKDDEIQHSPLALH